jgi:pyruvate-formate lyase-activating enzyme
MHRFVKDVARRSTLLNLARDHATAVRVRRKHPAGVVSAAPKRVIVEPTNACNLACSYCGNKDMLRPKTYLDLALYERLLDEMVALGVPRITLHTIGEPTLHPRIVEIIRMAVARGRIINVSTNATRLKPDLAREIVAAGPDVLNFSADAADAEVLARMRGGMSLDVLLEAMRLVKDLRDGAGPVRDTQWGRVRLPTITLTSVLSPEFTPEVERQFFEVFGPLVDDFDLHPVSNHGNYVEDDLFHRRFPFARLRDRLYRAVRRPCPLPWDSLVLLSDGTMSVCRFDLDGRVRIGRFGPQSLSELWNGQEMQRLRRAHMNFDLGAWPVCESCTGVIYENRYEHYRLSRKLMRRNGVEPRRLATFVP